MAKYAAKGVRLTMGVVPVDVAQIFSMSGPSLSMDPVEVSEHASVKHYREFRTGFRDGGEVTLGLRFDPAQSTQSEAAGGLLDVFESDASTPFQIIWPNAEASEWDFAGIVTGYEPSADFDAALEAQITIKIDSDPLFMANPV